MSTPSNRQVEPPQEAPSRSARFVWVIVLVGIGALALIVYLVVVRVRNSQAASARLTGAGRGIPVDVVSAERGSLPIYVDGLLGTVTPLNTVTIHTRVDGQLIKVAFVEGQIVKEGDLLAQIDPNPYKAALEQAQGQLVKDQAQLRNAQLDLKRYQDAPDAYTSQQVDTQKALVDTNQGIVQSDQGVVDSAQVNLDYCTITAPVTGRIGLRQVDQGNIVHAADTNGLAVITQLQPIDVEFSLQQDAIGDVINHQTGVPPLEASASDHGNTLATGKLIAIDSQVNITNGMVQLKAQFDNSDYGLFPSQLVTIRLLVNTLRHVVLVPSEAVQIGPDFSFVYVVKPDNTVDVRKIQPGQDAMVGDQDTTAIDSGLSAKEIVVVNGVDKLQQGSKVEATRRATSRPTTRLSTSRPSGRRRSLTSDSVQTGGSQNSDSSRNGE